MVGERPGAHRRDGAGLTVSLAAALLFLSPLGVIVNTVLLLRAAVLAKVRGGLMWRSTLYRPEELRPGRRIQAPWS